MSFTKEDAKRIKSDSNLNQDQLNELSQLLKEFPQSSKDSLLELYCSSGYSAAKVRANLASKQAHTKFLVSYDLHPDGTVQNYQEVPIE